MPNSIERQRRYRAKKKAEKLALSAPSISLLDAAAMAERAYRRGYHHGDWALRDGHCQAVPLDEWRFKMNTTLAIDPESGGAIDGVVTALDRLIIEEPLAYAAYLKAKFGAAQSNRDSTAP